MAEVNEDLYKDSVESLHGFKSNNDDHELNAVLMGTTHNNNTKQNEIYYDSLDNLSHEDDENLLDYQETFYEQSNRCKYPPSSARIQPRQVLKQQSDEDCLVNILECEEEGGCIEVQPTIMHTRQHLSTENLFREISNTIEGMHSVRNNYSKNLQINKVNIKPN